MLALVGLCAAVVFGPPARPQDHATPVDFRIAFVGDQGNGLEADAVLQLIASE